MIYNSSTTASSALTLLVGQQEGTVKTEWWGTGMVICLGCGLRMAQLMPLPLTVSCSSKSIWFYLSGTGSHGKSRRKGR